MQRREKEFDMTRYLAIAGAVFLAAVLGVSSYLAMHRQSTDAFAACRTGVAGGQIGGPFTLIDSKGNTVTDAQILTKPSLVYFGYGSCPDVCPVDNLRNSEATEILKKQGHDVQAVFISVDPGRDTPPVLADYASNFSNFIALTGTEDQIAAAAKAYKVYYQLPAKRDPGYTVDHTTMTYLVLPKTGFADFFQRDATAQQIADTTACFLNAS